MAHRPRKEMLAETRAKLVEAARHAFGSVGYAAASMDDFTAAAGLTRGALYHHFGAISAKAKDPWRGFVDENIAYIEMAMEPEIRRIVMRDGPAVLGDPSTWASQSECNRSMTESLKALKKDGFIIDVDPEGAARLLSGAALHAAQWIANADDPAATSKRAVKVFKALLDGLLIKGAKPSGRQR